MLVLRPCLRSLAIHGILVLRLASSACSTPGISDCSFILTSTAYSPPAVSLRITLAGSPHADPSFFPSRYSAAPSAASSSPVSAALSLQARSSSTADFCPWLSHAPLLPGCESCSATTGSSIPSGLSEDRNTRCAISERIHIAWLSPTAGWSLRRRQRYFPLARFRPWQQEEVHDAARRGVPAPLPAPPAATWLRAYPQLRIPRQPATRHASAALLPTSQSL